MLYKQINRFIASILGDGEGVPRIVVAFHIGALLQDAEEVGERNCEDVLPQAFYKVDLPAEIVADLEDTGFI